MKESCALWHVSSVLPSSHMFSEVSAQYLLSLQNCHCLPQMQSRKRSLRHIAELWRLENEAWLDLTLASERRWWPDSPGSRIKPNLFH